MSEPMHPDEAALIQYLDGELAESEWRQVEAHLACCGECRDRQAAIGALSSRIEAGLRYLSLPEQPDERAHLVERMAAQANTVASPSRVLRRFGWGMALAAGIAVAVLLAPMGSVQRSQNAANGPNPVTSSSGSGIDINGETFITLPYSNPDLPLNTTRIVEMRVPVSALAQAGLAVRPSWNEASDGMVAANVLLGIDGQPLGIDVLEAE